MNDLVLRPIETADASALAALQSAVFDDYVRSDLLSEVIAEEAKARPAGLVRDLPSPFGLAAYRAGTLIGWSQGHRQGRNEFCMLNSGVASAERRKGVYSELVRAVLAHAASQGYAKVTSRHSASNTAVLIAKLRMGFQVSGFEYSEVYGPLVQLTFIVREARRHLYRVRTAPIRTSRDDT
jgi:ribosomal protein S18 acetylase RimI-like enzyme